MHLPTNRSYACGPKLRSSEIVPPGADYLESCKGGGGGTVHGENNIMLCERGKPENLSSKWSGHDGVGTHVCVHPNHPHVTIFAAQRIGRENSVCIIWIWS